MSPQSSLLDEGVNMDLPRVVYWCVTEETGWIFHLSLNTVACLSIDK